MTNHNVLSGILTHFAVQLPVVIACLAAGIVTLNQWNRASSASRWALYGFGLALLMTLIVPITQAAVHLWLRHSGQSLQTISLVFSSLGVFWSLLRAATYVLLLVAVFAGRPKLTPPPPASPGQP
jgi:hypothetical protein